MSTASYDDLTSAHTLPAAATDAFERQFPNAKLVKQKRYVQSDDVIFTAGGLTSGIDLALHIVDKYYGRDAALQTAKYMEYESTRWME